ncbi:enoyl-CoA hydratase-related protein [Streptomyces sp. NPDC051921]|uniref:enoyl-CoA hydratase-related protein n=1 Tax=Streptomyces sp. NPDC051921 TaxID=3155806 RepID=UPI0034215246
MTTTAPEPGAETVTTARLRYVDLPRDAGRCALIVLGNDLPPFGPAMRPTTFGPQGLAALDAVLDTVARAAADGGVTAVAVTGRAYMFSTGADLALARTVTDRAEAVASLRRGREVFHRFGELPVPSFAFLNGVTIGGGLELALHCTYRTLSRNAPVVALPECSLGLVPAWGGAYLLPHLVGPDRAVTLMLDHPLAGRRMLDAAGAHGFGLSDALLEAGNFLDHCLDWAADVLTGRIRVDRPRQDDPAAWQAALARGRALVAERTHGVLPAPRRALELLELARAGTRDQVFAAAEQAAADLFLTDEFRTSLYALHLTQQHAATHPHRPDPVRALPVRRVGVLGTTHQARQLALLCAEKLRVPVVVADEDAVAVEAALDEVREGLRRLTAAGRIGAEAAEQCAALVTGSADPTDGCLAEADLLFEAGPAGRSPQAAAAALRRAGSAVPETCVIVTTGAPPGPDEVTAAVRHPERVVGLGLPWPVESSGLAELLRLPATGDAAYATAGAVATKLGKQCLPVTGGSPGPVLERLRGRFLGALLASADGAADGAYGDALVESLDRACETLALPTAPSRLLRAREAAGLPVTPAGGGCPVRSTEPDAVRERALTALAEEVRALLDEGVVASPADVDFALLASGDWPFHLGGVTPFLDRTGLAEKVTGRPFGPHGVPVREAP